MIDKLHLTINNRALKAAEHLYSGESILVEVEDSGLVQLQAANYKLVIFGVDKSILAASESFTASDTKWTATLNMATAPFQTYYENVSANSSKTLGMMIMNDSTGDTLCAGTVSVTAVPFPSQLSSIPGLYGDVMANMATTKMDKIANAVESNMAVFDAAGGVKDIGLKVLRNVIVEDGYSQGSLGIGDVRGIANHNGSVAVGDFGYTDINGDYAVAVGINCAAGECGVAVGEEAAAESNSVAIGNCACIEDANSVAIGEAASVVCNSPGGTAVGEAANVDTSPNGVALGKSAYVSNAANAVQLGQGTNERPGTLQFRSFPLMDADGKLAKEVIGGRGYLANQSQNTFIIDGRCHLNFYRVYSSSNSQTYSTVFDYSSMTYSEFDHFLVYFQGAPSRLNLTFHTAGEGDEENATIQNLDIEGAEIDWTSNDTHCVLFLVVIDDPGVPPNVFALTKFVFSH